MTDAEYMECLEAFLAVTKPRNWDEPLPGGGFIAHRYAPNSAWTWAL